MGRIVAILILFSATLHAQSIDQIRNGNDLFDKKQYVEAIAAFSKVPQSERTAAMQNRLGISYHLTQRFREAETAYKSAIKLDPKSGDAYNNLGALYYSRQNFSEAESQFRNALGRDPENPTTRKNFRAARYARENGRAARQIATAIQREKPLLIDQLILDNLEMHILMPQAQVDEAALHEKRADTLLARKLYEDAILEYSKSVAIDRYNASTVNRLGIAYHQSQRVNEAENMYKEALKLNPYYVEAMNNIGTIEYVRKNYEGALAEYGKALKIRPESPTLLRNIGTCLFALDRYEEGIKMYREALAVDPQVFDPSSAFGTLIQTTQRNEPMMNFYLAKVFAGSGDKDRAISYLYKAYDEGFKDIDKIKTEPTFAGLKQDERFVKLIATMVAAAAEPGAGKKN